MKRIHKIILISLSIAAISSCVKPEISVNADFTTNKDVYELYEDVIIKNTSTATNDIIIACKWDWGTGYKWGKQLEEPLSFDTVGEKEITLTAVTNSNVSGTVTKKLSSALYCWQSIFTAHSPCSGWNRIPPRRTAHAFRWSRSAHASRSVR